jgi:hypothetical protein
MAEETPTNPALDKEKPEGSRRTVDEALENESQQPSGVSNRPIEEEQEEQAELPPRGERKGGAHA